MIKKRYWVFVSYPESMPDNWLELLQETGLPIVISPLHDSDINADNTLKKPHYHIILLFNGPTSSKAVQNITQKINGTIPIPCENVKGYYRYLTHKDNPEKHQYFEDDIITLNGFNPIDYFDLTGSEVLNLKVALIELISDNNIFEYCDFVDFVKDHLELKYLDIAVNNTFFFRSYIASLRNKHYNIISGKDE